MVFERRLRKILPAVVAGTLGAAPFAHAQDSAPQARGAEAPVELQLAQDPAPISAETRQLPLATDPQSPERRSQPTTVNTADVFVPSQPAAPLSPGEAWTPSQPPVLQIAQDPEPPRPRVLGLAQDPVPLPPHKLPLAQDPQDPKIFLQ